MTYGLQTALKIPEAHVRQKKIKHLRCKSNRRMPQACASRVMYIDILMPKIVNK